MAVRENYREDVVGRANVEDTPELVAYYDDLRALRDRRAVDGRQQDRAVGAASRPRFRCCGATATCASTCCARSISSSPEKAGRRVIYLNNPGRRDVAAAVGWLYSGLQVMHPGEVASAHAHSASALRFIMEGAGAYTIVDGHKMTLGANDFVLTPERHLARARRRGERHALHLAGRARHPAGQRAGSEFLRGASRTCTRRSAIRVDDMTKTWGNPGLRPAHRRLEQRLFAAAQIRVGADLRGAAALRADDRRLALRRRHHELRQPGDRRPRDADDRRQHADAAARRADQGASAHRQLRLSGRQGHAAIRSSPASASTGSERDIFCVPVLGLARARQRVRAARMPACSRSTICR